MDCFQLNYDGSINVSANYVGQLENDNPLQAWIHILLKGIELIISKNNFKCDLAL